MSSTFTLFGFLIQIKIARPKTIWWHNDKSPGYEETRIREDDIFAINRVFYRSHGTYVYRFTCGRLCIYVGKI